MASAEERFRAKVEHRRDHDVWVGSTDHRGVGMVRIDGRLRTVQRAAWEFAHGPLPASTRVHTCAGERACVRLGHLSTTGDAKAPPRVPSPSSARRPKGRGSLREVRPGVWQIVVTDGRGPNGRLRRRSTTIYGDRDDAERASAGLASRVRRDLGDLRVRELVGRLIEERAREGERGVDRDRLALHEVVEPALGDFLAADVAPDEIERALSPVYRRLGVDETRLVLGLVRDAYRWAIQQGWCAEDPTAGLSIRSLM